MACGFLSVAIPWSLVLFFIADCPAGGCDPDCEDSGDSCRFGLRLGLGLGLGFFYVSSLTWRLPLTHIPALPGASFPVAEHQLSCLHCTYIANALSAIVI